MFANATNFYRKSGVAQWRDLRFLLSRFHTDASTLDYNSAFEADSQRTWTALHSLGEDV